MLLIDVKTRQIILCYFTKKNMFAFRALKELVNKIN